MRTIETIRRYPRIIKSLMKSSDDDDFESAVAIIDSRKRTHSELSAGLILEAFSQRHAHKVSASRVSDMFVGDDVDVPNTTTKSTH